jgi:hypothetical protein
MITRPVKVEQDADNALVILDANDERVCSEEMQENADEIAEALNAKVKP